MPFAGGLGAAVSQRAAGHEATRTARHQRLTSLILLPLTLWLAPTLATLPDMAYEAFVAGLKKPWNWIPLFMFIVIAMHHAWLGLQVVMDDYVHEAGARRLGLTALRILLLLVGVALLGATLKIALL